VLRELVEQLAGASGSVWFVATQHRSPLTAALSTGNPLLRERWRSGLVSGAALGAVAFAHVRRSGPPSVTAIRVADGWRIDGRLDWLTSWGLADVFLLMAQTPDDRVVQALLPAAERPGFEVLGELPLAAMSATSTVGVRLSGMVVGDEEVADVVERDTWLRADRLRTANANPAVFGLLRAAVDDLLLLGTERAQPAAVDAAHAFAEQVRVQRARAYGFIDEVDPDEALEGRLMVRAAALVLLLQVTSARVVAEGGAAMLLRSPAQRWAREALFHLVQAQTQPLREAVLGDLARDATAGTLQEAAS
jgi:alkylation response protein AidB-like acyl-CoA dehydrogenase